MAVFQSDDEINDGTQMWVNSLVMDGVGVGEGKGAGGGGWRDT